MVELMQNLSHKSETDVVLWSNPENSVYKLFQLIEFFSNAGVVLGTQNGGYMIQDNIDKKTVDFTLYNKVREFSNYVRLNIANNIPSVHRDMRIHLLDECYNLSSLLFGAVYNKGNIRMKYLVDMRIKLSLIDLLISDIRDLKIIKSKTINVAISKLAIIKNIVYGWVINEEKNKK